jgi:hypothetical protein
METRKKDLLMRSLKRFEDWMPGTPESMLEWYEGHPSACEYGQYRNLETIVFSYPRFDENGIEWNDPALFQEDFVLSRVIMLVYDGETIIADMSGLYGTLYDLKHDPAVLDYVQKESDWMDLEQYILAGVIGEEEGMALLVSSAYVTSTYRRQGIFKEMDQAVKEHVTAMCEGRTLYVSILSLDPDIAYYGPDATGETYYYSYEKDEPKRKINEEIIQKCGYEVIHLEADEIGDGTKIAFAYKKEADLLIDVPRS